ncbi:Quinolone resistance protein NorA [Seminavis robusta]|uniref:Quinolone resistance protein NorA n=1 Tax=Seminavis robusta TaxID=568900 RepID=A0A9N8DMR4_9STRA|nr:Quinolone resistance protein NorA [Seminavis robusta]|eukprot:Sro141_g065860.1 Quinolone resistance protein NorA (550) ;mRNA; f:65085-66734
MQIPIIKHLKIVFTTLALCHDCLGFVQVGPSSHSRLTIVNPCGTTTGTGSSSSTGSCSSSDYRGIALCALPPTRQQQRDQTTNTSTNSTNSDSNDDSWFAGVPKSVTNPLALLLGSQFLLFIGVGAVIPSIPLYGKEIGLSQAANGIVISAPAVALLLLANISGNVADRARKPAMMAGMALIVVSDIGTALAPSLGPLILARLGLGAGRGISEAGERGMLADLALQVPALRGRALAAQQAMVALGIAIGAPLGGLIVEQYGPRASFLCVSAAAFVSLVMYGFLPETRGVAITTGTNTNSANDDDDDDVNGTSKQQPQELVQWTTLLQDNQWRGLALCQCGASFGFAAKIASIPILATAILPGGAIGAGALLSAAGLSGLIGAPVGGFITDRAGAQFAAIVSGVCSGVALLGIPLALSLNSNINNMDDTTMMMWAPQILQSMGPNALAFSALVIAWSTSVAAQGPAMTALAQELAPPGSEATSMALPRAAGDGTYIVAPFLLGTVADKALGMPGLECAVAGSATILGALALAVLGRSPKEDAVPVSRPKP